jgi:hypothetical protein
MPASATRMHGTAARRMHVHRDASARAPASLCACADALRGCAAQRICSLCAASANGPVQGQHVVPEGCSRRMWRRQCLIARLCAPRRKLLEQLASGWRGTWQGSCSARRRLHHVLGLLAWRCGVALWPALWLAAALVHDVHSWQVERSHAAGDVLMTSCSGVRQKRGNSNV